MKSSQNPAKPNLFILGAPRSGTTAMREYLKAHPEIEFSAVREANFFNTDFSHGLRKFSTPGEYLEECFGEADKDVSYLGEKTVWYLYSKEAAENILSFNPQAKFIVMLRNPVEFVRSLHSKLFEIQQEDVRDFKTAWRLKDKRASGEQVPAGCPDKKLLLYGQIGKLGEQLERLAGIVDRERVHTILFDDFKTDTKQVYEETLQFLDLPVDNYDGFPKINDHNQVYSQKIQYLLRQKSKQLYRPLAIISEPLKSLLSIKRWKLTQKLSKFNLRKTKRPALEPQFSAELKDYFSEDVKRLSALLERDLTHWSK